MSIEQVDNYDTDGIMKRAAQPEELATCSCSGLTLEVEDPFTQAIK